MAYSITFLGSVTNSAIAPKTVETNTAFEAWMLVQHLDNVARIIDPFDN